MPSEDVFAVTMAGMGGETKPHPFEDREDMRFNTETDEWEIECCRCERWCPASDYDFDGSNLPEEGRHYGGCSERCIP